MKTKINLHRDEVEKMYLNAKSLLDAGFKGSKQELWLQAQSVLPPERQRPQMAGSVIYNTNRKFREWLNAANPASVNTPRQKRKYTKKLPALRRYPNILPGSFCPCCGTNRTTCSECGFDFRTITIV